MNKPNAALAVFMFAAALSVSQTGVQAASGDEASIRALESRFVAAVNLAQQFAPVILTNALTLRCGRKETWYNS